MNKISIRDIRLGAAYRIAASRKMARDDVSELLASRLGFSGEKAKQLAEHWVKSYGLYRAWS